MSLKPIPVRAVAFGLLMLKVSVDVSPTTMAVGANALPIEGGNALATSNVDEAVVPLPASAEVTAPVTLFFVPTVVPTTLTEMVQVPPGATVPLVRLTMVEFAVAPLTVPLQEFVRFGVAATATPAGKVSLKPRPVRAVAFKLPMVNVSVDVLPTAIDDGAKDLLIEGGDRLATANVAEAALPLPPSVEVTALVTLFLGPAVVPKTLTEMVQVPPAVTVPPARLTVVEFAVAPLTVPLHEFVRPGVAATATPAGKVSLKPLPVRAAAFRLPMLKVSVDVPFNAIDDGANALPIAGGDTLAPVTVNTAEAVLPLPPSVEVTALLILFFVPARVPAMLMLNVQVPPAATLPPARLTVVDPGP